MHLLSAAAPPSFTSSSSGANTFPILGLEEETMRKQTENHHKGMWAWEPLLQTSAVYLNLFMYWKRAETQLTGQAKLKGRTMRALSFSARFLDDTTFPPITGVDPLPKLHGPPGVTLDWYSLRHRRKYVSHSSRVHLLLSAVFRVPSQHEPLCSSPLMFLTDSTRNSKWPDASHSWEWKQEWGALRETKRQTLYLNIELVVEFPTFIACETMSTVKTSW